MGSSQQGNSVLRPWEQPKSGAKGEPTKRRKVVKIAKGKRRRASTFEAPLTSGENGSETEEVVIDAGDNLSSMVDNDLITLEEEMHADEGRVGNTDAGEPTEPEVDEAKQAHDDAAVHSVHALAIRDMGAAGIRMTTLDEKVALGIMPKVSPLVS
ncbi:hypothetical protein EDD15DRAFT_2198334 [Pisolithus albus]|nr:hypothetical protein EDD15DRAFT_2198334 [Pisolithus albus]